MKQQADLNKVCVDAAEASEMAQALSVLQREYKLSLLRMQKTALPVMKANTGRNSKLAVFVQTSTKPALCIKIEIRILSSLMHKRSVVPVLLMECAFPYDTDVSPCQQVFSSSRKTSECA